MEMYSSYIKNAEYLEDTIISFINCDKHLLFIVLSFYLQYMRK